MRGCCTSRQCEGGDQEDGGLLWWPWSTTPSAGAADARDRDFRDQVPPGSGDVEQSAEIVRRHVAAVQGHPNLLLYSISDLPGTNGSRPSPSNRGLGAASPTWQRPRQKAVQIPPNSIEGVPIETAGFVGKALVMYRESDAASQSSRASPHTSYFERRKRNWEVRVQGRFKRIPKSDMFIGIVLRDFNYDQAVAGHSKIVKRAGMALVKSYDLYLSWGDRCDAATKPDAELSHLVTGMSAWDQIIITPRGRTPPPLSSELQELGDSHGLNFERSKMGLAGYGEAVDETFRSISTEDTYTLCFWGVSQVIDILGWQFKIGTNISMARFFEDSPIHVAMYELERPTNGKSKDSDQKHLESMKRYYLDFMFWSNSVSCPSLPSRYVFVDAPEGLGGPLDCRRREPGPKNGRAAFDDRGRELFNGRTSSPCRRPNSPSSSIGSASGSGGARSLLAAWSEKLRWIPDYTCSAAAHDALGGHVARRKSSGSG